MRIPFVSIGLLVTIFAFSSCSRFVAPPELAYEETLVISGFLTAGDTVRNIEIGRLQAFSPDSSIAITDAQATITVDGSSYPLSLQSFHPRRNNADLRAHSYYEAPGLVAISGKQYAITVTWRGKTATAKTRVPFPLTPDSVSISHNNAKTFLIVEAFIRPRPNEVYLLDQYYRYTDSNPLSILDSLEFAGGALSKPIRFEPGKTETQTLRSHLWTDLYQERFRKIYTNLERYNALAVLYAMDIDYWDYYFTAVDNANNIGGFVQPDGRNVRWNVKGDGVGLFIGVATSRTPIRKITR